MSTYSDALGTHAYDGEFIISEANYFRSRDVVTLAAGEKVLGGTILGERLIGGAVASASVTGTGNGTVGSITVSGQAKLGAWVATCIEAETNGGVFEVKDPDGVVVGQATVDEAFSAGGLGFTISDGATDFVVGDYVTITVRGAVASGPTGTGTGTIGNVTVGQGAQVGTYRLVCTAAATNAGTFVVYDPAGDQVGQVTVGVAANVNGLSFTISDGATDFVVGDSFTITVAAGGGKYSSLNLAAVDGRQTVAGILYRTTDAEAGDQEAVIIARDAEVNSQEIIYPSGATNDQKAAINAQLKALGIIVRTGI